MSADASGRGSLTRPLLISFALLGLLSVTVAPSPVSGGFLQTPGQVELSIAPTTASDPTLTVQPHGDHAVAAPEAHPTPFETADGCTDCAFYLQEAASLQAACSVGATGSCAPIAGLASLTVNVVLHSSPYTTGFELNGYTNTGDWFQSMIGENWCGSGFEVTNEMFNRTGGSVLGPCVPSNLSMVAGDTIQLGLYVSATGSSSGDVCFTASDLSDLQLGYVNCVAQPDRGASPASNYFQFGLPNAFGFFTGPMTEVVDAAATACPHIGVLPTVAYDWQDGAYITQFSPWSDEWDPATASLCYNTVAVQSWTMVPGDAASIVADASANSTFGPRWESAQNSSSNSSGPGWTFSTDFTLPAPAPSIGPLGQAQYANVSFDEPIQIEHFDTNPTYADWIAPTMVLGHCVVSSSNEVLTCAPTGASGAATIQFVIGESNGHTLLSPQLIYYIHLAPTAPTPTASRPSADVGQAVSFSEASGANASGMSTYEWVLPSGCAGDGATVSCANLTVAGNVTVFVRVTDTDGSTATSGVLLFPVYSDPVVSSPTANRSSADVGQSVAFAAAGSGGSGGLSYLWSGLPGGCGGTTAAITCRPSAATAFAQVTLAVTDSNGWTVRSQPLLFSVYMAPSVTLTVRPASVAQAGKALFVATVRGGDGNLSYTWGDLPIGCAASSNSIVACSPAVTGTFWVIVTAIDQNLARNSSKADLQVSPTVLGLPEIDGYAILGTIGLVAVGAGTFLGFVVPSKRRKRGEDLNGPAAAERIRQFQSQPTTPRVNRLRSRMQRYGRNFRTKQDRRT
jgi:hypothetical protein